MFREDETVKVIRTVKFIEEKKMSYGIIYIYEYTFHSVKELCWALDKYTAGKFSADEAKARIDRELTSVYKAAHRTKNRFQIGEAVMINDNDSWGGYSKIKVSKPSGAIKDALLLGQVGMLGKGVGDLHMDAYRNTIMNAINAKEKEKEKEVREEKPLMDILEKLDIEQAKT